METSKGLFSMSLISPTIVASFPEPYSIRPLERDDYSKGFFECLKVLTSTGDVTEKRFHELYDWMSTQGRGIHFMLVIEHDNCIIGTGALLVERKL
jgi:glucosamine-phosphate N-acetyltransferase